MIIMKCDNCDEADTSGELSGSTGYWLRVYGEAIDDINVCSFACLSAWGTNMAFKEQEMEREYGD